jgi:hypothetical protein
MNDQTALPPHHWATDADMETAERACAATGAVAFYVEPTGRMYFVDRSGNRWPMDGQHLAWGPSDFYIAQAAIAKAAGVGTAKPGF